MKSKFLCFGDIAVSIEDRAHRGQVSVATAGLGSACLVAVVEDPYLCSDCYQNPIMKNGKGFLTMPSRSVWVCSVGLRPSIEYASRLAKQCRRRRSRSTKSLLNLIGCTREGVSKLMSLTENVHPTSLQCCGAFLGDIRSNIRERHGSIGIREG